MDINIKFFQEGVDVPKLANASDFGYDVKAMTCEEVAPNIYQYGLKFALQMDCDKVFDPLEYHVCISARPRSSIWKTGMILANCVPTIDKGYTGEIKLTFYHLFPSKPKYEVGDKIAQIYVSIAPCINFIPTDTLNKTDRGDNGFGSSDKK